MSMGDAVCTGWLVKSPPERKLQRYVSRGADSPLAFVSSVLCPWGGRVWSWGVPGFRGAKRSCSQSPSCRRGRWTTESEIARRAVLLLLPAAGWPGTVCPLCSTALYCHSQGRRKAWRKRWFVLRRGRMSGNPDVLEYYRNKHSSKPIRVIDLSECTVWKHAGPGFVRKEFQNNFVFIVKTTSRTFYLVAKTEEEMQVWVHSISQVCNLSHLEDGAGDVQSQSLRNREKRLSLNLPCKFSPMYPTASLSAEDSSYVPMSPKGTTSLRPYYCQDDYIPMSSSMLPELPADLEPPPVNRDLKPQRKCKAFD
ncbi:growth factor receptor bound protein 2-associated protein 3 [Cricetulus griseus]